MPYPESADWTLIPEHMREGLRRYLDDGVPPGSFLHAVLANDLVEAFIRADPVNRGRAGDYAAFLWRHAPANAWGSHEAVAAWIKTGGLNGRSQAEE